MGGADAGGMHGTRRDRAAAGTLLFGFNAVAIAIVSAAGVHYINEGVIDYTLGLVLIGLFSGMFVSFISTWVYDHLKMAFGLNKWQERMEASQKRIEDKQDQLININKDIADLLRKYLPPIAKALGVKVPPPQSDKPDSKDDSDSTAGS